MSQSYRRAHAPHWDPEAPEIERPPIDRAPWGNSAQAERLASGRDGDRTVPVDSSSLICDDSGDIADDVANRVSAEREVNPDGSLGDITRYTVDGKPIDIGDWEGSGSETLDDSERLMLALVANKVDAVTAELFKDNPELAAQLSSDNAMVYEPGVTHGLDALGAIPMMAFDVTELEPEALEALMETFGGTSESDPNGNSYNLVSELLGQSFNGSIVGSSEDPGTDEGYKAFYRMAITERENAETGELEKILGFYAEQVPEWSEDGTNAGGTRNGLRPGGDVKLGQAVSDETRAADAEKLEAMQEEGDVAPWYWELLDDIQDDGLLPAVDENRDPIAEAWHSLIDPVVETVRDSQGPLMAPVGDLLAPDATGARVNGMDKPPTEAKAGAQDRLGGGLGDKAEGRSKGAGSLGDKDKDRDEGGGRSR